MNIVREACEKYVRAAFQAKARTPNADAFRNDRKLNKAWTALDKAIEANVPSDMVWGYTIWNLAGSIVERIQEEPCNEAEEVQRFGDCVLAYLEALAGHDWIASLPLEHVFGRFPAFTDFGGFSLVNPKGTDPTADLPLDELLKRFRDILSQRHNVTFTEPEPDKLDTESYLSLGDHYYRKSGGYIPGRPQMVVKVGRGDEFINKLLLSPIARSQLALLAVCQIAYELDGPLLETQIISPDHCRLPTGKMMQDGLIKLPSVAVGFIQKNGLSSWWPVEHTTFETQRGAGYDPERFKEVWDDIAAPFVNLEHSLTGNVGEAIRNAISFVAKCRHVATGDLTLNSVIATETILNPFNKMGTSDGFAIFAAKLTASTVEERMETYTTAKALYNMRSLVVHQSAPRPDKGVKEPRKVAFNLFRACLKKILQWARATVDQGKECSSEEFKQFYLRTILS